MMAQRPSHQAIRKYALMPVARRSALILSATLTLLLANTNGAAEPAPYDPLQTADAARPEPLELVVEDAARSRSLPVRVYLPADNAAAPVILFSHGLGGSRAMGTYLANHWSQRGYVAVFLQHPGSDDSLWRGKPLREIMPALQRAAGGENFLLRVGDVPAVIDQLATWNAEDDHPLAGRLDLERVGMSGHSFGAVTTQAVSGQSFPGGRAALTDPRIKAALPMSPSAPRRGDANDAFDQVAIPWLLMTGTNDLSRIGGQTLAMRMAVYPALPPGNKYELVLNGAEHSAFTDRPLPGERNSRNPNHHRTILALSTAFWDAYFRDDAAARKWLDGEGPRTILDPKDRWQRK
jgi:predicted dienelactone hydrolase